MASDTSAARRTNSYFPENQNKLAEYMTFRAFCQFLNFVSSLKTGEVNQYIAGKIDYQQSHWPENQMVPSCARRTKLILRYPLIPDV